MGLRCILLFAIFYFSSLSAFAQASFIHRYSTSNSACTVATASSEMGDFLVVGIRYNSSNLPQGFATRLSVTGEVKNSFSYSVGGSTEVITRAVAPSKDGGFVIAGSARVSSDTRDAIVFKVNPSGIVGWKRRFATSADDIFYGITEVQNGYVVVGGTNFGNNVDLFVVKLSTSGGILWKKSLGTSASEFGFSATRSNDGGVVILGRTNTAPLLVKLSASGSIVWTKTITSFSFSSEYGTPAISETNDGGFVFGGNTSKNAVMITKIKADGSLLWSKSMNFGSALTFYGVAGTNEGGAAIACQYGEGTTAKGAIIRISYQGNIIWKKAYNYGNGNSLLAGISELPDGSILATGCGSGAAVSPITVKLNNQGTIVGGCNRLTSPGISIQSKSVTITNTSISDRAVPYSITSPSVTKATVTLSESRVCPVNLPPEPVCGDRKCEKPEDGSTCPQDCKPSGPVCGNGKCESGENPDTCPQDCKEPEPDCSPCYSVCIPPPPPDLNCGDIRFDNFRVFSCDPHGFDGDGDGVGCEN